MAAKLLDGKLVAEKVRAEVGDRVAELKARTGRTPGLSVVLVGEDPASQIYVRNKGRAAEKAGMRSETISLDASTKTEEILGLIAELNGREDVDGVLVQLPLPEAVDSDRVLLAIDPAKDVDGLHPVNVGNLSLGRPGFVPCTPAGIIRLLEHYEIPLKGARAVIVGRSNIVGKPMAQLLLERHATVTLCHSRTRDMEGMTRSADVLVAALGKPAFITDKHVKPGAVVIDVGINRAETKAEVEDYFGGDAKRLATLEKRGSTLVGDVHPARVEPVAGWLTPVPGGVGPLTIALLLSNTLDSFERRLG